MCKLKVKSLKFQTTDGVRVIFNVSKIIEVFSNFQSIVHPMPIIVKTDVSKRYKGEFDFFNLMIEPSQKNMLNLIFLKKIGLIKPS